MIIKRFVLLLQTHSLALERHRAAPWSLTYLVVILLFVFAALRSHSIPVVDDESPEENNKSYLYHQYHST